MTTVIIGIGSNITPEENIAKAKQMLQEKHTILSESEFIRTKPIGLPDQSDFINGAVMIQTTFDHDQLRISLKEIEQSLGRSADSSKFGPRPIDLDILVWEDKVMDEDFYTRDFVKQSVLDLMPDLNN